MNYLKKVGKSLLISFIALFVSMFFFTLLEYIGWLSSDTFNIIMTITICLDFLIVGILFGKKNNKKGWLEGIKLSIIEIAIIFLLNIFNSTTNIKNIIIYLIIFFATTIGSIIGVNKNGIKN